MGCRLFLPAALAAIGRYQLPAFYVELLFLHDLPLMMPFATECALLPRATVFVSETVYGNNLGHGLLITVMEPMESPLYSALQAWRAGEQGYRTVASQFACRAGSDSSRDTVNVKKACTHGNAH